MNTSFCDQFRVSQGYQFCSALHLNSIKHPKWIQFSALPIQFSLALFNSACIIGAIAEKALNSGANILGSPFFKNCKVMTGLSQLALFPFKGLAAVAEIATLFFNCVPQTVDMMVNPEVACLAESYYFIALKHRLAASF